MQLQPLPCNLNSLLTNSIMARRRRTYLPFYLPFLAEYRSVVIVGIFLVSVCYLYLGICIFQQGQMANHPIRLFSSSRSNTDEGEWWCCGGVVVVVIAASQRQIDRHH
jgi:hypothetical protein